MNDSSVPGFRSPLAVFSYFLFLMFLAYFVYLRARFGFEIAFSNKVDLWPTMIIGIIMAVLFSFVVLRCWKLLISLVAFCLIMTIWGASEITYFLLLLEFVFLALVCPIVFLMDRLDRSLLESDHKKGTILLRSIPIVILLVVFVMSG